MVGGFSRRNALRAGAGAAGLTGAGFGLSRMGWFNQPPSWESATLTRPFATTTDSPPYDQTSAVFAVHLSLATGQPVVLRARSPEPVDVRIVKVGELQPVHQQTNIDVRTDATEPTQWPVLLQMQQQWASGLYLAVMRPSSGSGQLRFAPFVVRPASPPAGIVVQVPFTTYHAYNGWGGASLYRFNSPNGVARELPMARPFDTFQGAGFAFYGDYQFAQWAAQQRYDVSYITSYDMHHDPNILERASLFVSVFHDEYWSTPMRRGFEAFVDGGGNAAFFAANSIFWRIRMSDTTMTCHKAETQQADDDPDITAQWRSKLIRDPEDGVLGSRYDSYVFPYGRGFDWTVQSADHWIYEGTKLANGDRMKGLVGYEWDNAPNPTRQGLTLLSHTSIDIDPNKAHRHEATVLEQPGKGSVFNAGTTYWPRFLLGDKRFRRDPRVEQMTHNVLRRWGPAR